MLTMSVAPARAMQADVESGSAMVSGIEAGEINLSVTGSTLRVTGAAKMVMKIYYVTGTKAASYTIENDDQQISTNLAKGIYVVKVGKFVRKITIQ